jgi:hypothetical protein
MRIITFDEAFMFWLLNETSCKILENFLPIVLKFDKLKKYRVIFKVMGITRIKSVQGGFDFDIAHN